MFLLPSLLLVLLHFLLPSPWSMVVQLFLVVFMVGQIAFWWWRVHHRGKQVEALIDRVAPVVRACRPEGKVRLGGATWDARCDEGADLGDQVVVRAWDHLTLIVERA
jgi:membrane protein implicated in regulation of membrane protease activity